MTEDGNISAEKPSSSGIGCSIKTRYVFVIMTFLCHFNRVMLRNNINVTIVAMVNSTAVLQQEDSNSTDGSDEVCPQRNTGNTSLVNEDGPFAWSSVDQGLVLGSYFYGYAFGQIPGAWVVRKLGLRYATSLSFIIASILTLVTPVTAWFSFELLVALRILTGLVQGVVIPAVVGGVGVWSPPEERSTIMGLPLAGQILAIVVVNILGGVISEYLGWEYVFYITGGVVLCWTALWLALVYDSPQHHPRISQEEKEYILTSLNISNKSKKKNFPVSWKKILTSPQVFAILMAQLCCNWSDYTLQTMLPTYMATIQNFDLAASGLLSSLPFLCEFLVITAIGPITDWLLRRKLLTVLQARKIMTATCLMFPALFYVLAGYSGCNVTLVVTYFCIATALIGTSVVGMKVNNVDIAPLCSALIVSYTNTAGNVSGFAAPQVATALLNGGNTINNWQKVFWLAAGLNLLGTIIYIIFAAGHEQPWAKPPSEEKYEDKEKSGKVNDAYDPGTKM